MTIEDTSYQGTPRCFPTHGLLSFVCGPTQDLLTPRAITRNEELYPDPDTFNPERFVGKMDSEAAHQVDVVFGFGRRVCPGKAFGEASVWLLTANIVATMNIEKSVDEVGQPITPNPEYIGSLVRYVVPSSDFGDLCVVSLMAHHSQTRRTVPLRGGLPF